MKYLKIKNDGELDIRLVHLMGGTTKSNKKELIGNFGSGLKYSLAYLLRNNLSFRIFIGDKEVDITSKQENIRDEVFDIIYIDGEKTSITTNMGREDWEAWMIIREIWSNALDEGGEQREVTTEVQGEKGTTTFFLQVDTLFKEVIDNWHLYFKEGEEPLFSNSFAKVYVGGRDTRIYKQGVLIHKRDKPSVFHYDFLNASLNELREYKGALGYDIIETLKAITDRKAIEYFLEFVTDEHTEGHVDLEWFNTTTFSKTWTEVLGKNTLIKKDTYDKLLQRGESVDNLMVVPDNLYKQLIAEFPFLSAVKVIKDAGEFFEVKCEESETMVKKALVILEHCEYNFNERLKFKFGEFDDKRVRARVDIEEKVVYFSTAIRNVSISTMVAILIEENEHYLTGFHDETRAFQQHFIDLYTRQLLEKYEIEV